jgi:hypothetical protein
MMVEFAGSARISARSVYSSFMYVVVGSSETTGKRCLGRKYTSLLMHDDTHV